MSQTNNLRLALHREVYPNNLDILEEMIQKEFTISEVNLNEMRIDIQLNTPADHRGDINRILYDFLHLPVIQGMIYDAGEIAFSEFTNLTEQNIDSIYNYTNISVTNPNDTIIIIL